MYKERLPARLEAEAVAGSFAYRHVMMAVDNSAHSNRGVEIGLAIAAAFGAQVTGSHAYAAQLHDLRFKQMEGGLPEQYRRESELEKQRETHDTLITQGLEIITDSYLDVVDEQAGNLNLQLVRKSVEGKNYRALLDDIHGSDYDLVVLGAMGLGAVRSSTLGSVCERIVRRTDRDVLVARDPKRSIGDGPIMVAIDGSSRSYAGLKTAMLLGAHFDVNVEVVSAFDPYFHYVAFHSIAGVLSDEAGEVFRFKEQEKLHEEIIDSGLAKIYQAHLAVSEKIAAEDDAVITTRLLAGKPYEVILRHIRKRNPSLLVIGRTGVHADYDLDIGSNAENLLRLAPCHLLITSREFTPRAEQIAEETTTWTEEAEARMDAVPAHVRSMARMAIIRYAQDHGHTVISTRIVDEAVENLLPADAMAAMGVLTKAARKRQLKNIARQEGAARTFDGRQLRWNSDAIRMLETVEDETARSHIRLRVEKLAHSEKRKIVSKDMVHRMLADGDQRDAGLSWSDDAIRRIERVPEGFMRDASKRRVEDFAHRQGHAEITLEICEAGLAEARNAMMQAMQSGGSAPSASAAEKPEDSSVLEWSDEAEERLGQAPAGFVRELARLRVEAFALSQGTARITTDLMDEKFDQWAALSGQLDRQLAWEADAWARIRRIPSFVRGMVIREIERCAGKMGKDKVTIEVIEKVGGTWSRTASFQTDQHPVRYSDFQTE